MRELSPLAYMSANYSRDLLVSLATVEDDAPWVRTVNAFYEDGAFYIITHESSRKLRQIARNPKACICGDWFTLHGLAADMGRITAPENAQILSRLRAAFADWYADQIDESDPALRLLCVRLTHGTLFIDGKKHEIDFADA